MPHATERKPLNKADIILILVASVVVLGGIAAYLIFGSNSAPGAYNNNGQPIPPLSPAQKSALLDSLKATSSPTTAANANKPIDPVRSRILDSLKASSTPSSPKNTGQPIDPKRSSTLDSLKAK
jgi:hypothetical protein